MHVHTKAEANTFGLPDGEAIRKRLLIYFSDQRKAVLAQIAAAKSLGPLETKDIPDITLPDPDGVELAADLEPIIDLIWDDAAGAYAPDFGLDPKDWQDDNPKVKAGILGQLKDLATSITTTLKDSIAGAIEKVKGMLAGGEITPDESIPELTSEIEVIFDDAKIWKARMIAVTEASRATHEMQLLLGRESGIVAGWRWMTASGACPICLEIEELCPVIKDGDAFAVIGYDPLYDTITCPPAHPNCMCSLEPVLFEDGFTDWGSTLIQPAGNLANPTAP